MTDQTNQPGAAGVIAQTALQTAEALAPAILSAAGTAASPQTAAIIALAPVAIQFLQSAAQLQHAGVMTADQLAALFQTIGQGIQSTHEKWAALNAAAKA